MELFAEKGYDKTTMQCTGQSGRSNSRGGLLYGFFPIELILHISTLCFDCSAILEIFLHIPFVKQARTSSMTQTILSDFKEAGSFIIHKNPAIFKMLLLLAGLNLFLTAMLPIGLSICSLSYALVSYGMIVIAILAGMSFIAIFNVIGQSFLQQQTPAHLLGKVSSYVMTLTMCAVLLGQAFYGICFDLFSSYSAWIVIMACCASMLLAKYAKRAISTLSVDKEGYSFE